MTQQTHLQYSAHGAHITSFDTDFGELFYLSSTARYGEGESIRGGVPIVAPWFATFLGDLQHGWARRKEWVITPNEQGYTAGLSDEGLLLGFEATAGKNELKMRLSIENTTSQSRSIQLALHPYFKVSHVEKIAVRGLADQPFTDRLTKTTGTVNGDITFSGEVDAIVHATPTVEIVDAERIITIQSSGVDSTVVWNPGQKKADSMRDVGAHEWKDFVCVEPALLGQGFRGVQLSPGEINVLEMHVAVSGR